MRAAREAGYNVYGCDPWTEAASIAREEFGERIKIGVFNPVDYKPGEFRVVILWSVIEHVTDPVGLIKDITEVLMPGGWLVITTPDLSSLSRQILRSRWHLFARPHLTFFGHKTISDLLQRAGFSVCRIKTNWRTYPVSYYASYLAQWSESLSRISLKLLGVIPWKEPMLCLPSGSMTVYARKSR